MCASKTTIDTIVETTRQRLIEEFDAGEPVSYLALNMLLQQKGADHLCAIEERLGGLAMAQPMDRSEVEGGLRRDILALGEAIRALAERLDGVVALVQRLTDTKAAAMPEAVMEPKAVMAPKAIMESKAVMAPAAMMEPKAVMEPMAPVAIAEAAPAPKMVAAKPKKPTIKAAEKKPAAARPRRARAEEPAKATTRKPAPAKATPPVRRTRKGS